MIFQSAALFDSMTVLDNVMFPLNMFSNDTLRERTKRAMFCLDRVNLGEAKDKFPGEISGGMQKRVAIARALVNNPSLVLADEPTGALDSKSSRLLLDSFEKLNKDLEATILMVTHSSKAASYASRVLFIKDGQIFHQLYKGDMSNQEMYQAISDTLTMLLSGGQ